MKLLHLSFLVKQSKASSIHVTTHIKLAPAIYYFLTYLWFFFKSSCFPNSHWSNTIHLLIYLEIQPSSKFDDTNTWIRLSFWKYCNIKDVQNILIEKVALRSASWYFNVYDESNVWSKWPTTYYITTVVCGKYHSAFTQINHSIQSAMELQSLLQWNMEQGCWVSFQPWCLAHRCLVLCMKFDISATSLYLLHKKVRWLPHGTEWLGTIFILFIIA